jgi:segregation and condensation protein B
MKQLGILEGLLFVVGDEGISLNAICETLNIDEIEAKKLLTDLKKEYEDDNHGLRISYLGDAFKLTTKSEHNEFYQKLVENPETNTLSEVALETLAIIAYNGPITRLEIDEMRGVSTSYMLRKLLARGLIKVSGKSNLPGKPNLYEITKVFLDYFGLATINDLPKFENMITNNEDEELYSSMYKENE